jgi:hypothetical protein
MPFNGSGSFSTKYNWQNDAALVLNISSSRMQGQDEDMAAGLSLCLTKDGQQVPIANIPMGGFRITQLGAPVSDTDAAQMAWVQAKISAIAPYGVGLPTVSSIAAVHALDSTKVAEVLSLGYFANGDGGGGPYYFDPADTTSGAYFTGSISGTTLTVTGVTNGAIAKGQAIRGQGIAAGTYITALGTGIGGTGTYTVNVNQTSPSTQISADNGGTLIVGSDGARWKLRWGACVTLRQFGAMADGSDSTYKYNSFATFVFSSGVTGHVEAGTYSFANPVTMDWGAAPQGANFTGDGINRSVLDLSAVTTSVPFLMTDSVGSEAMFYATFRDIGIKGNYAGPVLQIGQESYADAFNSCDFKIGVNNLNATTAAIGTELNGVYNSDIFLITNCAGHGVGLRARQLQFSRVFGSAGNADAALYLTGGYSFGNVFHALDLEVVNTAVKIDVSTASHNTWIGGQFVYTNGSGPSVAAIDATAGSNNRFIGVNFSSTSAIVAGMVGIIVYGPGADEGSETLGGLTISPPSGDGSIALDSVTANGASMAFRRAGSIRWSMQRNNATESGSNVGSNLLITRYSDTGVSIDNPVALDRGTGNVTLLRLAASAVGFFGAGITATRPTVSGSRASGAALTSLIGVLSSLGLITDSTTV